MKRKPVLKGPKLLFISIPLYSETLFLYTLPLKIMASQVTFSTGLFLNFPPPLFFFPCVPTEYFRSFCLEQSAKHSCRVCKGEEGPTLFFGILFSPFSPLFLFPLLFSLPPSEC